MINTLSIVRRLSKSGINREQAEAFADVVQDTLADAVNQQNASLATKDFVHLALDLMLNSGHGKVLYTNVFA